MKEIAVLQTHIMNYLKTKEVYAGYRKSGYSKKYYTEHAGDIELCKKSKKAFWRALPSDDSANSRHTQKEIAVFERASGGVRSTAMQKKAAYPEYCKAKSEYRDLLTYQANFVSLFGIENVSAEQQKER